jgi:hypothetical protein
MLLAAHEHGQERRLCHDPAFAHGPGVETVYCEFTGYHGRPEVCGRFLRRRASFFGGVKHFLILFNERFVELFQNRSFAVSDACTTKKKARQVLRFAAEIYACGSNKLRSRDNPRTGKPMPADTYRCAR